MHDANRARLVAGLMAIVAGCSGGSSSQGHNQGSACPTVKDTSCKPSETQLSCSGNQDTGYNSNSNFSYCNLLGTTRRETTIAARGTG